jgi:hypothetical protein
MSGTNVAKNGVSNWKRIARGGVAPQSTMTQEIVIDGRACVDYITP